MRTWRMEDPILERTLELGPAGPGAVSFDAASERVAVGAGEGWEEHTLEDEYLGFRVWDVATGTLIRRSLERYHVPSGLLTRTLVPAIRLSPDGRWVVVVIASADKHLTGLKELPQVNVATGALSGLVVYYPRKREEDDFDVVAFDAEGKFIAAADEMGQVATFRFEPPEPLVNPPDYPLRQAVVEKARNLGVRPLALAFDPSRHFLAGVRGNALVVWDLQSAQFKKHWESQLGELAGPSAALAFNASGSLLAVGYREGWQL